MQQMYDSLRGINVADGRIHAEAFGPSSLQRKADEETLHVPVVLPATTTLPVFFTRAEKKVDWVPESGTLLELAEQSGLSPEFSCRSGSCGTCRTRILSGSVAYPQAPGIKITSDEALICCAVSAQGCIELHLDL